jgi:antitoxin HicB
MIDLIGGCFVLDSSAMKYHFNITHEDRFWIGQCKELEGCITQATSREKLDTNMTEALNGFLDEPEDSRIVFPLPTVPRPKAHIVAVEVYPRIACALLVRQSRLQRGWSQRKAAKMLGFKNVFSYQRLENGRTSNP